MDLRIPLTAFATPLSLPHWWFWRVGRIVAWLFGARRAPATATIPRQGPAVVIAPHASFLDAPFLSAALHRPARFFTAAFYAARSAPLSWLLFAAGAIPVHRHRRDPAAVRRALRLLVRGEVLAFFPEGGRSWTGIPSLPATPAVKLLMNLKVPIYVAAIHGSYDYWPRFEAAPRPRRVRVGLSGPLLIPGSRSGPAREAKGGAGRWWSEIYAPRRGDVARVAREIRSQLLAAAAGAAASLRLEIPGRLAALRRVLCFCPECARVGLASHGQSLACPCCGVILFSGGEGRLRLVPAGGEGESALPVHELFSGMLSRLEARARTGLRLEEAVEAGEVPQATADPGAIPFLPAVARLDSGGLSIAVAGRENRLPLDIVAASSMLGSETLEIPHPRTGTVLYLRAPEAAFRILLAARAFLRLPFESMSL